MNHNAAEELGKPSPMRWFAWGVMHLCVLIVLLAVAYGPAMRGAFVFDDISSIVQNPSLRSEAGLRGMFSPFEAATTGGRPLLNASLALNYRLFGGEPSSFRYVNLGIHALNGLLVGIGMFLLLRAGKIAEERSALGCAAGASILWSLHPITVTSVSYVVQRGESLASFFYLLSVIAGVWHLRKMGGWLSLLAAAAFAFLGGLTKETAVTIPVTVTLLSVFLRGRESRRVFGARWLRLMGALGVALGPMILLALSDARRGTAGFGYEKVSEWEYFRAEHAVVWHYLRGIVWPMPLAFDYGWPRPSGGFAGNAYSILYCAGVMLAGWRGVRGKLWALFVLCFWVMLIPTSTLIPINDFAFDHRCYLASAWIIAGLTCGGMKLVKRARVGRGTAAWWIVVCVMCAIGLLGRTWQRNTFHADAIGLWSETAKLRPKNARAFNNLGVLFAEANRRKEAFEAFGMAARLKPDYAEAWNNLGLEFAYAGQSQSARDSLAKAVALNPKYHPAFNNYGTMLLQLGQSAEAARAFESACALEPGNADYQERLSVALRASGDAAGADAAAARADAIRRAGGRK